MNGFQTLIALICVIGAGMFLVAFVPKRRDWIQVFLSVGGLVALAVSTASFYTYAWWGPEVLPFGPILWVTLAILVIALKLAEIRDPGQAGNGRLLPFSFLVWTILTIGAAVMMVIVRHGVIAKYDTVVMFGILTLGLVQLGFAGILEERLKGSQTGRMVWTAAVIVGSATFIGTVLVALEFMTTRIVF